MHRRGYTDADLEPLQSTVAGWIAAAGRCGYDHIGELPHRIHENLRGRPLGELVQLWYDGEPQPAIVGLTIGGRFGSTFDVFVAPSLRGGPVERELIEHAYGVTAAHVGPDEAYVSTDVFSCDTHRMTVLTAAGFERFRVWDEIRERDLEPPPTPADVTGYVIRESTMDDADGLAAVRTATFGTPWTGSEYRESVMTRPGYDPRREIVAVAADGTIASYAVYWIDPRNRLGHVEPLGTHPDHRRRGLGRTVLVEAMRRMRADGMDSVSINHAADNEPARRLYASLGFTVRYLTYGYRRPTARFSAGSGR